MKKTMKIFGAIMITSFMLTSCGGGNKGEEKISLPDPPTDIKYEGVQLIDGPLSDYIEVVPDSYLLEIEKDESSYSSSYITKMKVKFKFIQAIDIKAGRGYNYYGPGLKGKVLDEQGAPIDFSLEITSDQDLATYLKRGSGEEWLTLSARNGLIKNEADALKILDIFKKGKSIRFNSEIVEEKFDSESSVSTKSNDDNDDDEIVIKASSGDCNEYLKGYEAFMKDYIAIIKKMKKNPNDMSVMTDYTSMMTEATNWASKTSDCAADAKFATKFADIQMKIANAVSDL